jgi:hypothetical protein
VFGSPLLCRIGVWYAQVRGLVICEELSAAASLRTALVSGGAAATVAELRRRFDEYLAAITKGKDTAKVRIVSE